MKYKDIFEFQDENPTREERKEIYKTMSEDEARRLILTCGTPQAKLYYRTLYREATGKKDFMVNISNKE